MYSASLDEISKISVADPDVLGLLDPDLLIRGTEPAPNPSIITQK